MLNKTMEISEKSQKTFTEILFDLEKGIKKLLSSEYNNTNDLFEDLSYIQKQSRYSDNLVIHHLMIDKIVKSGIGHVFLRFWGKLIEEDYLGLQYVDCGYHGEIDSDTVNKEDKNDDSFRNLQMLLSIIWNCTDSSVSLCESLVSSASIYQILFELSKQRLITIDTLAPYNKTSIKSCKQTYLIKAYLGILHNLSRHCSQSREMFKTAGALHTLSPLLKLSNDVVKAKAYLLLAYIVSLNDTEQCVFNDNSQNNSSNNHTIKNNCDSTVTDVIQMADDIVAFIVSILEDALLNNNHFSPRYAFWATEIASGINHLAMNDKNKAKLGRVGIFKLYACMLSKGVTDDEKMTAASGIWILSFHTCNKLLISKDTELMTMMLQTSMEAGNEGIRRALRGALWVVKSSLPISTAVCPSDETEEQQHVMISYHWSNQAIMIKVRDALLQRKYKVWFDVDNMKGSTLEAMALAVEKSAVMLLDVCQCYKESPNCRTEAEYAFRLRKDIIPLLTQTDFCPDGWLGILVGSKLYFDFSGVGNTICPNNGSNDLNERDGVEDGEKYYKAGGKSDDLFELQIERLVREIGERGLKINEIKKQYEILNGNNSSCLPRGRKNDLENEIVKVERKKEMTCLLKMEHSKEERASSILTSESVLCQRCAALISNPHRYPSLSLINYTPECDDGFISANLQFPQSPKLLLSPTPLHGYSNEIKSNTVSNSYTTNSTTINDVFKTSNSPRKTYLNNGPMKEDFLPVRSWGSEDVKHWFDNSGLAHHSQKFKGFTGLNLIQLRKMQMNAPEFFYNYFSTRMNFELIDTLLFSEFIEKINI